MGSSVEDEVLHRPRSVGSSTHPWPGLLLDGCIGEPPDHIVLLRPYTFVSLFQTGLRMPCLWTGWLDGYDGTIHHQGLPAAFHAISDPAKSLREGKGTDSAYLK